MRSRFNLLWLVWVLLAVTACAPIVSATPTPSPTTAGSTLFGVFEGITPCSALTRPLPQIPADTHCEQMIWKFTLYEDPATGSPTTYTLNSAYGVPQPNTPGLSGGGTAVAMEGNWTIVRGIKMDPDAVVYRLNPDDPETVVSFLKISDNILHVLNRDESLMVGNGGWSYSINRTDNRAPIEVEPRPASVPDPPPRPSSPPMPEGSSVLGVFEGRTRCHALVYEFTQIAPDPYCARIKWRLTLYQDQGTGAPTAYLYEGTSTLCAGAWSIVQGIPGDPGAIIYQLELDAGPEPVSFLKVDENHLFLLDRELDFLVGDALFSYTLSRTDNSSQ